MSEIFAVFSFPRERDTGGLEKKHSKETLNRYKNRSKRKRHKALGMRQEPRCKRQETICSGKIKK